MVKAGIPTLFILGLPIFALRTINIIANSVPSEASFFMMNIIHSKPRNSLLYEKVDKLEFISINNHTRVREDTEVGAEMIEERAE